MEEPRRTGTPREGDVIVDTVQMGASMLSEKLATDLDADSISSALGAAKSFFL
jgi:hypothetical protein